MDKSIAKIVKRGSKWCVVSETSGRGLGCYSSKEQAVTRLKQVEYFKGHSKGSEMDYQSAFTNMAKNIGLENKVSESDAAQKVLNSLVHGTIAGKASSRLLDKKHHFPVITETQARSSLNRVLQLEETPDWYHGTLAQLQKDVYDGVIATHPNAANLNVNVSLKKVQALSDGQTPSETEEKDVENPADVVKSKVPTVKRPSITTAELEAIYENEDARFALAGQIMENLAQQEETLGNAKKLASKLMKKGLSGEDFTALCTYLQENILREMIFNDQQDMTSANLEQKRQMLLKRLQG